MRGNVSLDLGQDFVGVKRTGEGQDLQLSDEPHVLRDGERTLLTLRNVSIPSIVVTSADRTVVYLLGVDYQVVEAGRGTVQVVRAPLGGIPDGTSVLVSYIYRADPAYDDFTHGQSYGVFYSFGSLWDIRYRFSHSRQFILKGIPGGDPGASKTHSAGTNLKIANSLTSLSWSEEESTYGGSTMQWTVQESLSFRPFGSSSLGFSGDYGRTRQRETGAVNSSYGGATSLSFSPTPWSRILLDGRFRKIDGEAYRSTEHRAGVRWEWVYAIWSGQVHCWLENQEDRITRDHRSKYVAFAGVRRSLY